MGTGRIVMGLLFFPRGGSAQVTRYLAAALGDSGRQVSLVSGSLGEAGQETHAPTFFTGMDVHHLDYTPAVAAFEAGASAVAAPVPMHPSYEDREGAPDPVLAAVEPDLAGHLAAVWEEPFRVAGAGDAALFHLHHLTSQHDAVAERWPEPPLLTHLHGTEIKFIEAVEVRSAVAAALGTELASMPSVTARGGIDTTALDAAQFALLASTRWSQWRHGDFWLHQMRHRASLSDHLVVVSPGDRLTAVTLLGVAPDRVTAIPNGVDTELFRARPFAGGERRQCFRRWLVEDPQGWDSSGVPGSVSYREDDLDRLLGPDDEATILMFVGRFTEAKRVPLLLEAFAQARTRIQRPASLLVWGGHPGEWEGEHPVTAARRVGTDGIFFSGWRGHEDLPIGLAACDATVMPSVNDSYPQSALESMAVGRPVIATHSGGFPLMINLDPERPTGWLVPPDDVDGLASAIVDAVDDGDEIVRRGRFARAHAQAHLSWSGRVRAFEAAYDSAIEQRQRAAPPR